jgi:hypothetical protein
MKNKEGKDRTNATLPIKYNVVLVREGGKNDGEKLGTFFTSSSPRHPVVPYGLVLHISEAIEPTISFEIVAHILEVRGPDFQNRFVAHKYFDEKLASLQEK